MVPENVSSVLIRGDRVKLEKVLFHCSIQYAEQGLGVWFISPQPFNQLPENFKSPDKEVLKLITFLYLKDEKDLLSHLNGIHIWRQLPHIIILNGFEHYCAMLSTNFTLINAAFTMASILNATSACAFKHAKRAYLLASCNILPCDKHRQLDRLTDMYFSNVLLYDPDRGDNVVQQIKKCLGDSTV